MDNNLRMAAANPKSQLAASIEAANWARDHNKEFADLHGLAWNLRINSQQKANPEDYKTMIWHVEVRLETIADSSELVRSGVLDPVGDERLLQLLGESRVSFALRPQEYTANKELEALQAAQLGIAAYCQKLASARLAELKRKAVERFIDQKMQFGFQPR